MLISHYFQTISSYIILPSALLNYKIVTLHSFCKANVNALHLSPLPQFCFARSLLNWLKHCYQTAESEIPKTFWYSPYITRVDFFRVPSTVYAKERVLSYSIAQQNLWLLISNSHYKQRFFFVQQFFLSPKYQSGIMPTGETFSHLKNRKYIFYEGPNDNRISETKVNRFHRATKQNMRKK